MDEVPAESTSNVAIGHNAMGGDSDGNTASNYNVAIGASAFFGGDLGSNGASKRKSSSFFNS